MPGIGGLFRGRPMSVFRPQWTDIDGAYQTALMPGYLRGKSRGFPSFPFNSFYLTSRINSPFAIKSFCPQSTWIRFYCSWPQRRRRRINWGRDRVMDFSRREGSDKFMQKWRWIFTIRRSKRKCLGFIHQQWRGIGGEYKEATGKSSTQITFS